MPFRTSRETVISDERRLHNYTANVKKLLEQIKLEEKGGNAYVRI